MTVEDGQEPDQINEIDETLSDVVSTKITQVVREERRSQASEEGQSRTTKEINDEFVHYNYSKEDRTIFTPHCCWFGRTHIYSQFFCNISDFLRKNKTYKPKYMTFNRRDFQEGVTKTNIPYEMDRMIYPSTNKLMRYDRNDAVFGSGNRLIYRKCVSLYNIWPDEKKILIIEAFLMWFSMGGEKMRLLRYTDDGSYMKIMLQRHGNYRYQNYYEFSK